MLLPALVMRPARFIGVYQLRDQPFQHILVTLAEIVSFVLGKDGQQKQRHGAVVVVVDDPYPTTFAPGPDAPAAFPHATGTNHDDTVVRVPSNKRDEVLPLSLTSVWQLVAETRGFQLPDQACIAGLSLCHRQLSYAIGVRHWRGDVKTGERCAALRRGRVTGRSLDRLLRFLNTLDWSVEPAHRPQVSTCLEG